MKIRHALFARIAEILAKNPGIRPENILVNLLEVPKENWSFGNGIAQYQSRAGDNGDAMTTRIAEEARSSYIESWERRSGRSSQRSGQMLVGFI